MEEAREMKNEKEKKATARRKKKDRQNRIRLLIIAAILVVAFGVSIYKIIPLNVERIVATNKPNCWNRKNIKRSQRTNSLEYVEKKAREDQKLVLPGAKLSTAFRMEKDEKK